jgi:3-deoxy-D-manno-octulosonic-acid transferase
MRYLYTLLFYCCLPFLFIRLWRKGKKTPGYRLRWKERLGFIPSLAIKDSIWIHAVSLGEMIAAKPLIQALRAQYSDKILVITTTTVSGSSLAQQYVSDKVYHYYLPYDLPGPITRFLDKICPAQVIIMETELWPNLLHYTAQRNVPILLANARLSVSSMQSYARIVTITREMLSHIDCIAAQTQQDADHFMQLGAKPEQIRILGNVKFDMPLPMDLIEKGHALRQSFGAPRPTLIAASTHAGEEEIILRAFHQFLKNWPDALLILVPRHPERFEAVAELCQQQGHSLIRRTQQQSCTETTQIFLGDTLGELFLYYAMADIAFVGGSFAHIGGHNPLEPAAVGLPVLTGPIVFNFTEIFKLLHKAGAALTVADEITLCDAWTRLMHDPAQCKQMGQIGQQVVDENRGAVKKHLEYLQHTNQM